MVSFDFNLEPTEAIDYLKNKGFKLTFNYDELIKEAHHKAFTVAKVTRADLLNDIHEELLKSLKDGIGFKEFKNNIKPTLQKKGWWGKQDIVNPSTGEIKTINIGARRLKTIYETNMRMAYNQGRYQQMQNLPLSVYWRYVSQRLNNSRDAHIAMHGIIKHRDDPFWKVNKPMNGWNCKCEVVAYSKKAIERKGWSIDEIPRKDIASKDFAYDTAVSKISKLSKVDLDKSLSYLPKITNDINYDSLTDTALLAIFYKNLGVKENEIFIDKINDPMMINNSLFSNGEGDLKIRKKDRHLVIDELALAISNPDEIYLEWNEETNRLIKKMFRYFTIKNKKRAVVAMFEYKKDKTQGITVYTIDTAASVEKKRIDKLIYKRESD